MATNTSEPKPDTNPRIKDPGRVFRHSEAVQLRFNDIDLLGHVNNSVYMQLFDTAKVRYFQAVRPDWDSWDDLNAVIANINCDFLAPVFFDDPVEVVTAVTHIGEKSLRLEQRLRNPDTGTVNAVCVTVMVGYNQFALTTEPITPVWADAFRRYEGAALE